MTSSTTEAEPWFHTLISQCLASLYLLNLDGCPAADSVGKTSALWVRLLWAKPGVRWHYDVDLQRIRAAFASLAGACKRWPAPALFWENLPVREPLRQSRGDGELHPDWGRERQAEALDGMYRQFAELGRDRWGNLIVPAAITTEMPRVSTMEQLRGLYGTDRKSAAAGDAHVE